MKIYVPLASVVKALGADDVAAAVQTVASARGLDVNIVRNGTWGMIWLEPLVGIETEAGRIGYGAVALSDVARLLDVERQMTLTFTSSTDPNSTSGRSCNLQRRFPLSPMLTKFFCQLRVSDVETFLSISDMSQKLEICSMCAHLGDSVKKTLCKSHVVPRGFFKDMAKRNDIQPNNQFITLSSDPMVSINADEDQGATKMLCNDCEQRLSREIEKPTFDWLKQQTADRFSTLDSVLLCRFAASIWWRAMISKHDYYQHVTFNHQSIYDIMEASLDSTKTLKTLSFRLRRLTDSTGSFSRENLKQAIIIKPSDSVASSSSGGHPSFSLLAGGFGWEVFHPRLKRTDSRKQKCMEGHRRYEIPRWDFSSDSKLISLGALQLDKLSNGKVSHSFKKRMGKTGGDANS